MNESKLEVLLSDIKSQSYPTPQAVQQATRRVLVHRIKSAASVKTMSRPLLLLSTFALITVGFVGVLILSSIFFPTPAPYLVNETAAGYSAQFNSFTGTIEVNDIASLGKIFPLSANLEVGRLSVAVYDQERRIFSHTFFPANSNQVWQVVLPDWATLPTGPFRVVIRGEDVTGALKLGHQDDQQPEP